MARTPTPHRPGSAGQPRDQVVGDEAPGELYPLRSGGSAVPDRSREPVIGLACASTGAQSRSGKRVVVNPETEAGPEVGTRGNLEVQKTAQKFGHARREARGSVPVQ